MSKRKSAERIKLKYDIPPEYYWYYSPNYYGYTQNYNCGDRYGGGNASWSIRWIYGLILLLVIVLQFGRNPNLYRPNKPLYSECEGCEFNQSQGYGIYDNNPDSYQLIDNSVLFLIVVFLLLLCGGCWWGCNNR